MSILTLGDCNAAWTRLFDAISAGIERHAATSIIQVGDFGSFPKLIPVFELLLHKRPLAVPLHVIDGNHEDHPWLWGHGSAGILEDWGSRLNPFVHRRDETATIEGVRIGFLGGALHADRRQHGSTAKGTTNWITDKDADRAAAAFNESMVNLVVTHSCPHSIGVGMRGAPALLRSVEQFVNTKWFDSGPFEECGEPGLSRLWSRLHHNARTWVFGHFHTHHVSTVSSTEFRCVGSSDGSDGRTPSFGHSLHPQDWSWRMVNL